MIEIRNYKQSDYSMIREWWSMHEEVAPLENMLPEESTYILEKEGMPTLCVTIYLTNTPQVAWVDNFVANPLSKDNRKETKVLLDHIEQQAKDKGYKNLFCMSEKRVLKDYYNKLGFQPTMDGVTTFIKEIG